MTTRRQFLGFALFVPIVALGTSACSESKRFSPLPSGSQVVALGDSLTFGFGADKSQSYPVVLAQKTGWQIENMGVNGDTTADVLQRLDAVIVKNPKLVLLGIGGNDVLKKVDKTETKNNLTTIISTLQGKNIPVVLIAQPYLSASALFGKASDNPVYKEIAQELNTPLLEKAWSQILSDNALKSDQIHANAQGYAKFSEMLYDYLKEIGYA